jgi:hypothetical protein
MERKSQHFSLIFPIFSSSVIQPENAVASYLSPGPLNSFHPTKRARQSLRRMHEGVQNALREGEGL